VKFVRQSNSPSILRLVDSLHDSEPTYAEIGATLDGDLPRGFHHDRYETSLGRASRTFQRAVNGLKTWEAHSLPSVRIFPSRQKIETGATVVVTLGNPLLALAAPCRIVRVVDEPDHGVLHTERCPAIPNREKRLSSSRSQRTRRCSSRSLRSLDPVTRWCG
jgi:hypothetical protein